MCWLSVTSFVRWSGYDKLDISCHGHIKLEVVIIKRYHLKNIEYSMNLVSIIAWLKNIQNSSWIGTFEWNIKYFCEVWMAWKDLRFCYMAWSPVTLDSVNSSLIAWELHIWNLMQNSSMLLLVSCDFDKILHIVIKFCTCHDSIAVVACAEFYHNLIGFMIITWEFMRLF